MGSKDSDTIPEAQKGRKRCLSNGVSKEGKLFNHTNNGHFNHGINTCGLQENYEQNENLISSIEKETESVFEKKFKFKKEDDFGVPPVNEWFVENNWTIPNLKEMKYELNSVKEWLNDMDMKWHEHTTWTNRAGDVVRKVRRVPGTELVTQAWCKFYEIVCTYPIIPCDSKKLLTLHLCEAPGAFITAFNYYLCSKNFQNEWNWLACTLNPYYEGHSSQSAITDDRLIFNTLNQWEFGKDGTGDILNAKYLNELIEKLGGNQCNLVTADGSIDCLDNPGEQENVVSSLQYSEVVVALKLLAKGGSLVVKKFTLYECMSVCIMYLLNCMFKEVNVFKPATSKAGNSEVYVVCLEYTGTDINEKYLKILLEKLGPDSPAEAMFPLKRIPHSFLQQLEKCCKKFLNYQKSTIMENLESFYQGEFWPFSKKLCHVKENISEKYLEKFKVREQYNYKPFCIEPNTNHKHWNSKINPRYLEYKLFKGSYNEKKAFQEKSWEKRLLIMEERVRQCLHTLCQEKKTIFSDDIVYEIQHALTAISENWITTGKPYTCVNNSKFADSCLLELWNEMSKEAQVLKAGASVFETKYHWNIKEHKFLSNLKTLVTSESSNSPLIHGLYPLLHPEVKVVSFEDIKLKSNETDSSKLLLFNLTGLHSNFLQSEILTKSDLINYFITALEILQEGDSISVCLHHVLTRVTVGVFYLILSVFRKGHILPLRDYCNPTEGQVWTFIKYCNSGWTKRILEHLKAAKCREEQDHLLSEQSGISKTVLEVVPINILCRGSFFESVVNYNNRVLRNRITQLIEAEKNFLCLN